MLSMEAALRKDNVQPDPKGLGPIYSQNFLTYLKKNPHMNITAFGLNCAAPEDLIASLHGMFDKKAKVNNLWSTEELISLHWELIYSIQGI